jgi:hypothetical protein
MANLKINETNLLSATTVSAKAPLPEYCRALGYVRRDGNALWTLPVCPYPQVASFRGSGDRNEPASYGCAQP